MCTLTAGAMTDELVANWQKVATHFDLLLDRPKAVEVLEQRILQLAVQGRLVRQDAKAEAATQLVNQVAGGSASKLASRKTKPLRTSRSETAIASLPVGWAWSSLGELCAVRGGSTPSKADARNWSGSIPWVSPKDMKTRQIRDAQDHVSEVTVKAGLTLIPPGSLLIVVRGMILAHSFPVAENLVPVTINQDMKALTPYEPKLLPYLMLICEGMKAEILQLVERSTHGTCKLESSKIFNLPIAVPPLAEQFSIAARVAELRALCGDLRECLKIRERTQARLTAALLESARVTDD